jgi:phospholipase A1
MKTLRTLIIATLLGLPPAAVAAESDDACLSRVLSQAAADSTAAELRERCADRLDSDATYGRDDSLIVQRLEREREVEQNRSVLLPHRRNYFMPLSYAREPNNAAFNSVTGTSRADRLDNAEAQFQFSVKVPLAQGLLHPLDGVYFGFTTQAFWQVYNTEISAPFRETNYEPELFWVRPVPWRILGGDAAAVVLGLSHESNGRSQPLSRSWNRLYANLIWERNRFVFSFKPWWRIPEDAKTDPSDADGDDNPDIEHYLGHFEFSALYREQGQEIGLMLRNNLHKDDNRNTLRLEWTFPLYGRLRGYAQYFNGYGESLIDYDARIERIGFGFLLTDLL